MGCGERAYLKCAHRPQALHLGPVQWEMKVRKCQLNIRILRQGHHVPLLVLVADLHFPLSIGSVTVLVVNGFLLDQWLLLRNRCCRECSVVFFAHGFERQDVASILQAVGCTSSVSIITPAGVIICKMYPCRCMLLFLCHTYRHYHRCMLHRLAFGIGTMCARWFNCRCRFH